MFSVLCVCSRVMQQDCTCPSSEKCFSNQHFLTGAAQAPFKGSSECLVLGMCSDRWVRAITRQEGRNLSELQNTDTTAGSTSAEQAHAIQSYQRAFTAKLCSPANVREKVIQDSKCGKLRRFPLLTVDKLKGKPLLQNRLHNCSCHWTTFCLCSVLYRTLVNVSWFFMCFIHKLDVTWLTHVIIGRVTSIVFTHN